VDCDEEGNCCAGGLMGRVYLFFLDKKVALKLAINRRFEGKDNK